MSESAKSALVDIGFGVILVCLVGINVVWAMQPSCVPVTYTARIDATEAELSQGEIAYLSLTVKASDGSFAGTHMVAGDRDTPLVDWLVRHRHKTVTLTLCGD